jgi:threonine synthase
MISVQNFECTLCHRTFDPALDLLTCPHCGELGILEINYDYDRMKQTVNRDYFRNNPDFTMWRYLPMMSLEGKDAAKTLKVGWTPLYPAPRLGKLLGIKKLFVKDDGLNPTASLKDRASAVAVLKAIEKHQPVISCASTGNAASSLAGNAARMGLKSVIFVPKRAPLGKLAQLMVFGATVISVDGDYKDAFNLSKAAIDHYGWYNRNAAINPHLVEGKKTVSLEIAEQLDFKMPDWVAVSVGDGCTVAGVYKGFYDFFQLGLIAKIPRILGVQSSGCAPFVEAYQENRELRETEENTIADSISVGIPRNPVKAINAIRNSKGTWIAVSDDEILSAMRLLGQTEGIFGEPAGVTSLAGVKKAVETGVIKKTETVVVVMTGNGLKDPANAVKAAGSPVLMKPDLQTFIYYMEKREKEANL